MSLSILWVHSSPSFAQVHDGLKPLAPGGWKLVWNDEFDGSDIDHSKWGFEAGNGWSGWGNHELEYYTDRAENAFVSEGKLHIRAIKGSYKNFEFTSARLLTKGHFAKQYGRFEFRAKLPVGKGLWPALWLMPADSAYGTWPVSGEIDVTESRGQQPDRVLGTIHYGDRPPRNEHSGETYILPSGGSISEFHVYALEWEPSAIRWYVDDKLYSTKQKWWSAADKAPASQPAAGGAKETVARNPWPAPFDKPFYIIMNVAVGGDFLGSPDSTTSFPQDMVVDYVRVYDKFADERANSGVAK